MKDAGSGGPSSSLFLFYSDFQEVPLGALRNKKWANLGFTEIHNSHRGFPAIDGSGIRRFKA
jgi:hypothetical protein